MPGRDAALSEILGECCARHVEQWPEPGTPTRRHPGQSGRTTPPQEPEQNRLRLVLGMVTEHDHCGVRLSGDFAQRGATGKPGPGLRAPGPEFEPDHMKLEATLHRVRSYLGRHLRASFGNAMVDVPHEQFAPVDWRALEPVIAGVGTSGMILNAPHPHAALLFLDYLHSKEGQQAAMKGGLSSPRTDIGSLGQKFKKLYMERQYPPEELEKKFDEWENLLRKLFIRKR